MRNENCHQDVIKRTIKPKFPQQTTFGTLFVEIAQKRRVLVSFCMKTVETCFAKTCVKFGHCYGNHGWAEVVENYFLFSKLVYLNCQKVSSS